MARTRPEGRGEIAVNDALTCELVKRMISEWTADRSRPFPYLQVGEHLTGCVNCLTWSTEIAYDPADHYLTALRLRLSDVLGLLGKSLLAVWSGNQEVKIRFTSAPTELHQSRARVEKFLDRYGAFSPETGGTARRLREMLPRARPDAPLASLEPYELVRHFLETALQTAPDSGDRLGLLNDLGIAENYRAMAEARAGHVRAADEHFDRARRHFSQVADARKADTDADRSARVSACINLAGTEVQQHGYSEVSIHRAIGMLFQARRLVTELGLNEVDFTSIYSNLLISYLRLYLEHDIGQGLEQARALALEIRRTRELGTAFYQECLVERADPELAAILERGRAREIAALLRG